MKNATPISAPECAAPLALTLDMEKYLGQLEDWNITEEQKREFIAALWGLLVSSAEIGLQIHPVQNAQKLCGQVTNKSLKAALTAPDALYLDDLLLSEKFIRANSDANAEKEVT